MKTASKAVRAVLESTPRAGCHKCTCVAACEPRRWTKGGGAARGAASIML